MNRYKKFLILFLLSSFGLGEELFKSGNSFIVGGIVHQNIDGYENTQALHLSYSYMNFDRWGFDGGYVQSFYKGKSLKGDNEKNFSSAYLFGTYLIPLNSYIGFKSKAGYAKNKDTQDSLSYGIEIISQMNPNGGFSFGFQKMNKQVNYFILNVIYKLD